MTDSTASARSLRTWGPAVPFALLFFAYLPVLRELVADWWQDSNYSHGFLVPLVSAWLLWTRRGDLRKVATAVDPVGLLALAGALLLFVVGNGAAEYFTVRVSFVFALTGLIWYLFGRSLVRAIWFELFFLLFMIPIPYVIYYAATFPMQLFASKVTVTVLHAIGLGAVRQGNIIHIAGYSLEVAEACSGMRSVVTLLALGALFAHMTQRKILPMLLVFVSTVPLAIVANVFRVFVTTILASFVGDAVVEEPLHSALGASVFVVAFMGLFVVSRIVGRIFK